MKGGHGVSALGAASTSWAAFLSYMFCAPLFLVGPVLTAQDYLQQVAGCAAAMDSSRCSDDGAQAGAASPTSAADRASKPIWAAPVVELGVWVGIVELARRTFYCPELLLQHSASMWWVACGSAWQQALL